MKARKEGLVRIKERQSGPGDTNGGGRLNTVDLIPLAKHVSGKAVELH